MSGLGPSIIPMHCPYLLKGCISYITWRSLCPTYTAAATDIGDAGAEALGAALEPRQNPDGTWVFNTALSTLDLGGGGPDPPLIPILRGKSASLTLPGDLCTRPAAAENYIGADGAVALGAALEPKQNPDGTWVFNPALSTLNLRSAGPDPPLFPIGDPLCRKSASLTLTGNLCALPILLQTMISEMRELLPLEPPWSQSRTLMGHGSSTRP